MAHVLIVNDEDDLLELCGLVLEERGHGTSTAKGVNEAADAAAEHPPDVLLLDLVAPGSSGERVLDAIRQRLGRQPPVVVMSASADGASRARAMGADAFLAKPFTEEGLVAAVEEVCR